MTDTPAASRRIILASASTARQAVLRGAGIDFQVEPARIDEDSVKMSFKVEGASAQDVAIALADLKAAKISARHPDALVIGADQMLDCNGIWFDKPPDRETLHAQLMALRGKTHHLEAALCVHDRGKRIWHVLDRAELTMRDFSDDFLKTYIDAAGDDVLASVGGYRLEGIGAQLFSKINGDYFTILGLPLLPLLDFLRHHGVVQK